jgi:hypothetical protein
MNRRLGFFHTFAREGHANRVHYVRKGNEKYGKRRCIAALQGLLSQQAANDRPPFVFTTKEQSGRA